MFDFKKYLTEQRDVSIGKWAHETSAWLDNAAHTLKTLRHYGSQSSETQKVVRNVDRLIKQAKIQLDTLKGK